MLLYLAIKTVIFKHCIYTMPLLDVIMLRAFFSSELYNVLVSQKKKNKKYLLQ